MIQTIPFTFIHNRTSLSWREAAWGYHKGYLGWSDVVQLAVDRLKAGDDDDSVVELAGLSKSGAHEVGHLLDKLASQVVGGDEESSKAKWLYLRLAWLFDNRSTFSDPLELVETVYADFDYPEEVTPFVRYMPVADGYDPSAHSTEENQARLFEKWRSYLDKKTQVFALGVRS